MIDKDMKNKDLKEKTFIGNSTMDKLSNNENVTVEVLAKICGGMDIGFEGGFPGQDFVITDKETGRKIGLEVKKTDSKRWEVPGGSAFESIIKR